MSLLRFLGLGREKKKTSRMSQRDTATVRKIAARLELEHEVIPPPRHPDRCPFMLPGKMPARLCQYAFQFDGMAKAFSLGIKRSLEMEIVQGRDQRPARDARNDVHLSQKIEFRKAGGEVNAAGIRAEGVNIMEFSDDIWDAFGAAAEQAMDEFAGDPLYDQIRESFATSMKSSSQWLSRSEGVYTRQRDRVLNG